MANIRVEGTFNAFKIYINNSLHLKIFSPNLVAIHSWIDKENNKFCIQYTIGMKEVLTEYDNFEIFADILEKLNELL